MDTKTCSLILIILYSLLPLQFLQITEAHRKNLEIIHLPSQHKRSSSDQMDPEFNVFFHYKNLKFGNRMKIYFPKKDPSTSPHLLTKQESDTIPFTSSQLPYILNLFSFPKTSKQAKAIKTTLHHCEFPSLIGETKFCSTSLESMLDSIKKIFSFNSHFKVLTTNYLNESKLLSPLQNYTIFEPPTEIFAQKVVACHMLPYPYAVFYCHGQASDNLLYKVLLDGADDGRVEATAMCHMDTSQWDPDHVAFRVLGTRPGGEPVCHFFPADNLVWIPVSN